MQQCFISGKLKMCGVQEILALLVWFLLLAEHLCCRWREKSWIFPDQSVPSTSSGQHSSLPSPQCPQLQREHFTNNVLHRPGDLVLQFISNSGLSCFLHLDRPLVCNPGPSPGLLSPLQYPGWYVDLSPHSQPTGGDAVPSLHDTVADLVVTSED